MRLRSWLLLPAGAVLHAATGRTPAWGYHAMRQVQAHTDGRLGDARRRIARRLHPYAASPVDGFLGSWTPPGLVSLAEHIEHDGYVVLDRRLDPQAVERLNALAARSPCTPLGGSTPVRFEASRATALRYDYSPADLADDPDVATIAGDGTFAAIASQYFGTPAQFDFVTMWWTTAQGERDLSAAAQLFHADMDRLCFLKFFVYLTDVTDRTGPHVFVRGSHRRKPRQLREDRRFHDREIAEAYDEHDVVSIVGPAGTVFAADTRGLHKGAPVTDGERLVLQVEFAIDLFGQDYTAPEPR